jgi:hypothetical protein
LEQQSLQHSQQSQQTRNNKRSVTIAIPDDTNLLPKIHEVGKVLGGFTNIKAVETERHNRMMEKIKMEESNHYKKLKTEESELIQLSTQMDLRRKAIQMKLLCHDVYRNLLQHGYSKEFFQEKFEELMFFYDENDFKDQKENEKYKLTTYIFFILLFW